MICTRIYRNGDFCRFQANNELERDAWVEHNRVFRFGQAMFVDGVLVHSGYYTTEEAVVEYQRINKIRVIGKLKNASQDGCQYWIDEKKKKAASLTT